MGQSTRQSTITDFLLEVKNEYSNYSQTVVQWFQQHPIKYSITPMRKIENQNVEQNFRINLFAPENETHFLELLKSVTEWSYMDVVKQINYWLDFEESSVHPKESLKKKRYIVNKVIEAMYQIHETQVYEKNNSMSEMEIEDNNEIKEDDKISVLGHIIYCVHQQHPTVSTLMLQRVLELLEGEKGESYFSQYLYQKYSTGERNLGDFESQTFSQKSKLLQDQFVRLASPTILAVSLKEKETFITTILEQLNMLCRQSIYDNTVFSYIPNVVLTCTKQQSVLLRIKFLKILLPFIHYLHTKTNSTSRQGQRGYSTTKAKRVKKKKQKTDWNPVKLNQYQNIVTTLFRLLGEQFVLVYDGDKLFQTVLNFLTSLVVVSNFSYPLIFYYLYNFYAAKDIYDFLVLPDPSTSPSSSSSSSSSSGSVVLQPVSQQLRIFLQAEYHKFSKKLEVGAKQKIENVFSFLRRPTSHNYYYIGMIPKDKGNVSERNYAQLPITPGTPVTPGTPTDSPVSPSILSNLTRGPAEYHNLDPWCVLEDIDNAMVPALFGGVVHKRSTLTYAKQFFDSREDQDKRNNKRKLSSLEDNNTKDREKEPMRSADRRKPTITLTAPSSTSTTT
eukprot:CAMPEP_0174267464 /NCGR_PEP_ID=MMETSP0439-20130205/33679_1 /TAXON_ID=0 /ORGANISM="Stereomyxa ramosa, Strain Chinc5" /LENGTH=614 /DNA_ID=CAMNT_0015354971 /DNA_START=2830 /DNA_END=4670 /DNA_ORIENTATION=+